MINEFDFGPVGVINLRLDGEARDHYGEYSDLPDGVKDALQLMCHAVMQIADDIKRSEAGVFWIDSTFMILHVKNDIYGISNFDNGMAVMNFRKDSEGQYSTDFFSVKQLALTDPIISYACKDMKNNGRRS